MSVIKKYLYPISFSLMLFSSSAMAKLHPIYFKGVTNFFREGKEFFSPTLGEVALEVGLIENLRFNGPFVAAYNKKGEREYVKDKSKDPLWNVVKILFPSVNGQLGTVTTAETNFARYVKNPKTVALLLNYAKQVEEVRGKGNIATKVTQKFVKDIFETLDGVTMKEDKFRKDVLNPLLKNIQDAIKLEKEENSLYPQHTTEQALSAFFAYQFNKQEEIWSLIEDLDGSIVDHEKPLPTQDDLLNEEDIPSIKDKETPYTIDDFFDLTLANLWQALTPYKGGINLLNNGSSFFYDRKTNTYREVSAFADCVETAGRHIRNLLFYNHLTREFNLAPVRAFVEENSPENPYFQNVEDFYAVQTPLLANAGDIGTRSLNNKIVADLNAIPGGPVIGYNQGGNELRSGFINFINVYQKVFRLPLKELPVEGFEKRQEWVEDSLKIFFTALNPTYTYDIFLDLSETGEELSGNAGVTVKSAEIGENLFSFNLMSSRDRNHTEINQLKILRKGTEVDYTSVLRDHINALHEGTAEDSLWLLAPAELQAKAQHPLYKLFSQALADNESRINFLQMLKDNYTQWSELQGNLPAVQLMIKNVNGSISWVDEEIVRRISPIILSMIESPEFQETLFEGVKALKIADLNFEETEQIVKNFRNLDSLDLSYNTKIEGDLALTDSFKTLKKLNFSGNKGLTSLTGLENIPDLETLVLSSAQNLTQLPFTHLLHNLKKLDINGTGISTLTGLENIPNIQELNLQSMMNLREVSFTELLEKLRILKLSFTGISKLIGLENTPNVEELDLRKTKNLTEVSFTSRLESLRKINLDESGIQRLEGLENVPNLQQLSLWNASNLREVSFTEVLEKLTIINLAGSGIKLLEGLENAPNLEQLKLFDTSALTKLELTRPFNHLRKLDLWGSGITTLTGLDNVPNVEELNLRSTKNLTEVSFTHLLENLRTINLDGSNVSKITGLENVPNIEELDLRGTRKLKEIAFRGPLEKLRVVSLISSGIQKLTGLENAPSVETLNLEQSDLKALTLTKAQRNLKTLDLRLSRVSKLRGLKHVVNLETLNLDHTFDLKELALKGAHENLKTLNLEGSYLSNLSGLENTPNLESLNLRDTKNLNEIDFTIPMRKLRTVNFWQAGASVIKGIENLSEVEEFDFGGTKKLTQLSFTHRLENLRTLDFRGGAITSLTGFENTPGLQFLHLGWTENLTEIAFTEPLKHLTKILLWESGITKLSGLGFLENLKELDLSRSKNIKNLKFEKENKDLVLKLRGSGIKREDIEGIEYLDESKISF